MIRYLIADTETTGATPADKVCEIAFMEVDANLGQIDSVHSLLNPERPISASAMGVHDITQEMVKDSPTIEQFFSELDFALDDQIVLIAHKVAFDRQFIEPHLPSIYGQLCTLKLARRYLPDAENHKLSTLRYQYGLDGGKAHSADGDVLTCLSLVRFIQTLADKTLDQLIAEDHVPLLIPKMPFGKWRDVAFPQIPRDYCQWAIGPKGLTEVDPDLKYTLTLRAEGKI